MFDWLFQSGGYLGILAFMVLTGCGLPLPEEVAIVFAGVRSAHGEMYVGGAFAACLLGALAGDAVMYAIGRRFGHSLLRRHPRLSQLIHAEREEYFERAILRHGFKVLLLARFMVGVRGPVYLAAGVVRMPFRRFLVWDLVCATTVVSAFFALAYYLGTFLDGDSISRLVRDTEVMITVAALVVVGIGAYIALRRRRQRLLAHMIDTAAEAERASPSYVRGRVDRGPAEAS